VVVDQEGYIEGGWALLLEPKRKDREVVPTRKRRWLP